MTIHTNRKAWKVLFMALSFIFCVHLNPLFASTCEQAIAIDQVPFNLNNQTTEGMGDDYDFSPCDNNYIGGNEAIYVFTPTVDAYFTIRLENISAWSGIHLIDDCPDESPNCIASHTTNLPGTRLLEDIFLTEGETYFIIVSTYPQPQFTSFDIFVENGNPPPAGTDCNNPIIISDLPFAVQEINTAEFDNIYSGSGPCFSDNYLNDHEVVLKYQPTANQAVSFSLENIQEFFTAIHILDACPDSNPTCVGSASNTVNTNNIYLENIVLQSAVEYYIVISTWDNPQHTIFDLNIVAEQSCNVVNDFEILQRTDSSTVLNWTQGNLPGLIAYREVGGIPGEQVTEVLKMPIEIDGLLPQTDYECFVKNRCGAEALMISGVYDGPLSGGNPKGVELLALYDIEDLSQFGIGSANNGEGTNGIEFHFPAIAVEAGEYIYWTSDSILFEEFFGIPADFESPAALINGDDAVELFNGNLIIDAFGYPNTSGTGQPWEYKDGWAYRLNGQRNNNGAFSEHNWKYSGIDLLEGAAQNDLCEVPFPLATFIGPPTLESEWSGPFTFRTLPATPVCGGYFVDSGGDQNYFNNTQDTIHICPSSTEEKVKVTFTQFELDNEGNLCLDELFIYDGPSTESPLFSPAGNSTQGWCWNQNNVPSGSGDLTGLSFTSSDTSGCLTFVFHSDEEGNLQGWQTGVECIQVQSCYDPGNMMVSEVEGTSAIISWDFLLQTSSVTLSYREEGFEPENGIQVEVDSTLYSLTGLQPFTTYEVYLQSNCNDTLNGTWIGPVSFSTSCSSEVGDDFESPIEINAFPFHATGVTDFCYTDNFGFESADNVYRFQNPDCNFGINISTCDPTTDFDTYVYLLDENQEVLFSNDDALDPCNFSVNGLNRMSALTAFVEPNKEYYIVVEGFGPNEGKYELNVDLNPISAVQVDAMIQDVNCHGENSGSILLSLEGGAEPYTILWNDGDTSLVRDDLIAGEYSLVITDNCQASQTLDFEIKEPEVLEVTSQTGGVSALDAQNGYIITQVNGGLPPYDFSWDNGANSSSTANLGMGETCVTIIDQNLCELNTCFDILLSTEEQNKASELGLEIFPNPTADKVFINLRFEESTDLTLELVAANGQSVLKIEEEQVRQELLEWDLSEINSGLYFLKITKNRNYGFFRLIIER